MWRAWIVASLIVGVALAQSGLSDCDPLVPEQCGLPMPNDFWRAVSPSGKASLRFSSKMFPIDSKGKTADPQKGGWNDLDGFSPSGPIVTYLGDNVDISRAPHHADIARSLDRYTPTVLLDTETGKAVPHWAELDESIPAPVKRQALYIWPAVRLEDSRRYIVALRNFTDTVTVALIKPSAAFLALRDNITTTDPDVELRRNHFEDIFGRLARVGFRRSDLQQAWDFTTGSLSSITDRLIYMREDGFKRAASGIQYKIVSFEDNVSDNIARRVQVQMMVPRYVNSDWPGARLVLSPAGVPVYQALSVVDVTIQIPVSLVDGTKEGAIFQYGHGLFGSRNEANGGYLGEQANKNGWVIVATDWIGLATLDAPAIYLMIADDITNFGMVPDRCQQGVLNALFAMRMLKEGRILDDPAMQPKGKRVMKSGATGYYNGNSQGGILGTVYMAVTTDVTRGVLGVPGGPYALLLPRSVDADKFNDLLAKRFSDNLDRARVYAVLQMLWDRADPGGYMNHVSDRTLPRTSKHEVIVQHALGDAQVSNLGAYMIARSAGAYMFESNSYYPGHKHFGYKVVKDNETVHTALLVSWEYEGVPPAPDANVPPSKDTDTHGRPRKEAVAQQQMLDFFLTGNIKNYCNGPCKRQF